jgi:plastocyanin
MPTSIKTMTRRDALRAGGIALAGLATGLVGIPARAEPIVEIRMRSVENGAHVGFDPVGLLVRPGTTVRWIVEADVHTTTAYHPINDAHPLRIPEGAEPWGSDYLVNPGDSFEVKLTVEGVYDYFCAPHEMAGMVARIIVGRPTGPGSRPFDYFKDDPAKADWKSVPPAASAAFPSLEEIMQKQLVALPRMVQG